MAEYITKIEINVTVNTNKATTKVSFDNFYEAAEWLWEKLTDEQRETLARSCCQGCGSLDKSCQCWNDE